MAPGDKAGAGAAVVFVSTGCAAIVTPECPEVAAVAIGLQRVISNRHETYFSCRRKVKFCDAGVGQIDQNWHGNA